MEKPSKKIILLVIGILFLGAGLYVGRAGLISEKGSTVHPKKGPVVEAVYGLGTVTATHTFQLKIGVTASVKQLWVREGDRVEKNTYMIRLSEGPVFKAPFAGTITSVVYKEGETVFPQSTILTLTNLDDLYTAVSLEQQGALKVHPGQKVRLSFESLRSQKIEGQVRTLFPSDGNFVVHVDSKDLPKEILPGMTADLAIEVGRKEDAMLIPMRAIQNGKIILIKNGKKQKTDVKLGVTDGEYIEVLSPELSEEDELVM